MEMGFIICAQIAIFALVSVVPIMVLKQRSAGVRTAAARQNTRSNR